MFQIIPAIFLLVYLCIAALGALILLSSDSLTAKMMLINASEKQLPLHSFLYYAAIAAIALPNANTPGAILVATTVVPILVRVANGGKLYLYGTPALMGSISLAMIVVQIICVLKLTL